MISREQGHNDLRFGQKPRGEAYMYGQYLKGIYFWSTFNILRYPNNNYDKYF